MLALDGDGVRCRRLNVCKRGNAKRSELCDHVRRNLRKEDLQLSEDENANENDRHDIADGGIHNVSGRGEITLSFTEEARRKRRSSLLLLHDVIPLCGIRGQMRADKSVISADDERNAQKYSHGYGEKQQISADVPPHALGKPRNGRIDPAEGADLRSKIKDHFVRRVVHRIDEGEVKRKKRKGKDDLKRIFSFHGGGQSVDPRTYDHGSRHRQKRQNE